MRRRLAEARDLLRGFGRDERGFVVMTVLCVFLFLFVLCCSIYAVGETVRQKIRLQNACDAAAYSAAVVQADGLSRMATVNRAMSWTYVHMCNQQMEYITYRWMRLVAKRFWQDHANAKGYHKYLTFGCDPNLGYLAIAQLIADAQLSNIFGIKCTLNHWKEGPGWWCGLGPNTRHHITFNGHVPEDGNDKATSYELLAEELDKISERMDEKKFTCPKLVTDDHPTAKDPYSNSEPKFDYDTNLGIGSILKAIFSGDTDSLMPGNAKINAGFVIPVNTTWGAKLGKQIDADKATIQLMNALLPTINANMRASMEDTARFVLATALRDPRLPKETAFKGVSAYISIPQGLDPYELGEAGSNKVANIFAPVYNTEPSERLFIEMGNEGHADKPLYEFFKVKPRGKSQQDKTKGWGFDQWFVRAGTNAVAQLPNVNPFNTNSIPHLPTIVRTEGRLGIQRAYKDANINETGAGSRIRGKYVSRGNHIANLLLEGTPKPKDTEKGTLSKIKGVASQGISGGISGLLSEDVMGGLGKLIGKLIMQILKNALKDLANEFCDITPSCGNSHDDDEFFMMCTKSDNTCALYADYDWASCKWLCLTRLTVLRPFTFWAYFRCPICVATGAIPTNIKMVYHPFTHFHRGFGHYGIPKVFCGERPRYIGDTLSFNFLNLLRAVFPIEVLPPFISIVKGNRHGYMWLPLDFVNFFKPLRPLVGGSGCDASEGCGGCHGEKCAQDMMRSQYRSCAMFFDGVISAWNFGGNTEGDPDDPENEKGMAPTAGIVNGHARIYGDDPEIFDSRYVGEKCCPWLLSEKFFSGLGTVVVGASLKHENPFVRLYNMWGSNDKGAGNTIFSAFDPAFERTTGTNRVAGAARVSGNNCVWAMSAARAAVRRNRRANADQDGERMYQVTYDDFSDPQNLKVAKPYHYENGKGWVAGLPPADAPVKIVGGCVCDKSNGKRFEQVWNLCEQDWDATLLPLRYAGRAGKVKSDGKKGSTVTEWTPAAEEGDDVGFANPLNPINQKKSWTSMDKKDASQDSTNDVQRLDSLLPDGQHRIDLKRILKGHRIL